MIVLLHNSVNCNRVIYIAPITGRRKAQNSHQPFFQRYNLQKLMPFKMDMSDQLLQQYTVYIEDIVCITGNSVSLVA